MTLAARETRTPILDALRQFRGSIRSAGMSHESDVLSVRLSPDMGRRLVAEFMIAGCDRSMVENADRRAQALFEGMAIMWFGGDGR